MFTLAPMENMPYFNNGNNKKELFKAAVDTFNEQLHKKVFNLVGHHQSLELDLVDAHDLLKDMINTPSDFGFKDGQHSFWDACQGQCTDSVDDYIWWDKTHLTGGAHRVIANSILISDSLEPSVTLSLPVADLIQGSRFQSPHYQPKYNTGLIDKLVKEWDAAKVDEHSDVTVDKDDAGDSATDSMVDEEDHWIRPLYFGALLTVVLCLGFVFYNKRSKRRAGGSLAALSGLVRNRNSNNGRGQFTPLRNLDTPPSEV